MNGDIDILPEYTINLALKYWILSESTLEEV